MLCGSPRNPDLCTILPSVCLPAQHESKGDAYLLRRCGRLCQRFLQAQPRGRHPRAWGREPWVSGVEHAAAKNANRSSTALNALTGGSGGVDGVDCGGFIDMGVSCSTQTLSAGARKWRLSRFRRRCPSRTTTLFQMCCRLSVLSTSRGR